MKITLIAGGLVSLLIGIYAIFRVRSEYSYSGTLSSFTVFLVWFEYIFHSILVALAAWYAPWQLNTLYGFSMPVGVVLLLAGVAMVVISVYQFGSVRRMSGQDTSQLVTSGIYRLSRNPQNVGWYLGLLGIVMLGRSPLAFGLSVGFILLLHYYIVKVEEPFLKRIYGADFVQYERKTSRYWGRKNDSP
ncbi:MAG: hypothetical protein MAGBODY4_00089 [Candidatus Marinimicrobia bacterium]|nr:hypothetical protein [Candidatus Neomarinimicrobiota bacterium]